MTGVAETTILVAKADAVVLVVDARKFNFELLEQGLAQLRNSGANVVGIVLNRVRRRKMPLRPTSTIRRRRSKTTRSHRREARSAMVRLSGLPRSG